MHRYDSVMSSSPAPEKPLVPTSSLNRALNILGDRWSLMVVQEAFLGASRFEEFQANLGAPRSTLSMRLQCLTEAGVLEKRPQSTSGMRMAYHLTPHGLALFDSMMLMWSWGVRWGVSTGRSPTEFVHLDCGEAMTAELHCRGCGEQLTLHSCSYVSNADAAGDKAPPARLHRRRLSPEHAGSVELVDLLGDRWTALTVSAQYFGIRRFDAIQNFLGIASNILTDRLRTLELAGVFERRLYAASPARYEYRLTDKGKDLYPHALAMMAWADSSREDGAGPPVMIRHQCGAKVEPRAACSACHGELVMHDVAITRLTRPVARQLEQALTV